MPSIYAHHRFGEQILPRLPGDVRGVVVRNRAMFDAGLQGPDFFFFYRPTTSNPLRSLAHDLHHRTGQAFFTRACRDVRMDSDEDILAYLYGLLGHYCLDSLCHGYLAEVCESTWQHNAMESEFERFLLVRDGVRRPHAYRRSKLLRLGKRECERVSIIYENVGGEEIFEAMGSHRLFISLLTAPNGVYRTLAEGVTRLLGEHTTGLMVPAAADPAFAQSDRVLSERFDRALALYPELLDRLLDHLSFREPLDERFSPIFG